MFYVQVADIDKILDNLTKPVWVYSEPEKQELEDELDRLRARIKELETDNLQLKKNYNDACMAENHLVGELQDAEVRLREAREIIGHGFSDRVSEFKTPYTRKRIRDYWECKYCKVIVETNQTPTLNDHKPDCRIRKCLEPEGGKDE